MTIRASDRKPARGRSAARHGEGGAAAARRVSQALVEACARPLVALWIAESNFSWRTYPLATDTPHVHSAGSDPDRILVAGDGLSTGRGVVTHDLGLPGYLARGLTALTGRAADVDLVVSGEMSVAACIEATASVDFRRFDAILLSIGVTDALALTPLSHWEQSLGALLDTIETSTAGASQTFVLSIPTVTLNPHFPTPLGHIVDRHSRQLNDVTQRLLSARPDMRYIDVDRATSDEPGTNAYEQWGGAIALVMSNRLTAADGTGSRAYVPDESDRVRAAARVDVPTSQENPVLNGLMRTARAVFGTEIAAISLIGSETQIILSASGMSRSVTPRSDAVCDVTIRHDRQFVVEDMANDARFSQYPIVVGPAHIRFYAGYPIESPNGQRIGALCLMDSRPRAFTDEDAEVLRTLAQQAQEALWSGDGLA